MRTRNSDFRLVVNAQAAVLMVVALSVGPTTACGSKCTVAACVPSTNLYFANELDGEGQYVALMQTANGTVRCEHDGSKPGNSTCSSSDVSWVFAGSSTSHDSAVSQEPGGPAIGLRVEGQHESIQLRLLRNEVVAGEVTVTPKYKEQEINGKGCGTCPIAEEHLALP